MRKETSRYQAVSPAYSASNGRFARLLRALLSSKPSLKKAKKPLAVTHLYGMPRPGSV